MAILSDELRSELNDNILQRQHEKLLGELREQLAREHHWDEQERHWKRQRIIWTITGSTAVGSLSIAALALAGRVAGWW